VCQMRTRPGPCSAILTRRSIQRKLAGGIERTPPHDRIIRRILKKCQRPWISRQQKPAARGWRLS
jgi:hypothetical protein